MTFKESFELFNQSNIIPIEKIYQYLKENKKRLDPFYQIAAIFKQEAIPIKCVNSVHGNEMRRITEVSIDHYYFSRYISILKNKGLTYLALLQFVANNSELKVDNSYWESMLGELDITISETKMLGIDIKRVLTALFTLQKSLLDKLNTCNDLSTYDTEYLSEYARMFAISNSEEMYPSTNILSKIELMFGSEMLDDTSIAMSKRQIQEKEVEVNKQLTKFIDDYIIL